MSCPHCDPFRRWFDLIDLGYTNWVGRFYGPYRRFAVNSPKLADNDLRLGDVLTVTKGPASMIGQQFLVGR